MCCVCVCVGMYGPMTLYWWESYNLYIYIMYYVYIYIYYVLCMYIYIMCIYIYVNRRFSPICMFLVDIEVICSHSRRQEIHSFGMTVVFSEDLQ